MRRDVGTNCVRHIITECVRFGWPRRRMRTLPTRYHAAHTHINETRSIETESDDVPLAEFSSCFLNFRPDANGYRCRFSLARWLQFITKTPFITQSYGFLEGARDRFPPRSPKKEKQRQRDEGDGCVNLANYLPAVEMLRMFLPQLGTSRGRNEWIVHCASSWMRVRVPSTHFNR